MITTSELAGFFAAHAIWSICGGEALTPMLAFTTEEGKRHMHRFASDDLTVSVHQGKAMLDANEMNADDAVLLCDGHTAVGCSGCDAIIIEMTAYFSPEYRAGMAVPYTSKSRFRRFLVHRPKLFLWEKCDDFDMNSALEAFLAGVAQHEEGAEVWKNTLDESK